MDLLFISHLDADHVNGVDALTARMQVDAVVLPCLDALQITAIACEAIDDAGVRGTIREFIKNPALWFSERGSSGSSTFVEMVVMVRFRRSYRILTAFLTIL